MMETRGRDISVVLQTYARHTVKPSVPTGWSKSANEQPSRARFDARPPSVRSPTRFDDALLHGDVGAFHVLRHARAARAVPCGRDARRLPFGRSHGECDLRSLYLRFVHLVFARRL